jgi:hypothetical protein
MTEVKCYVSFLSGEFPIFNFIPKNLRDACGVDFFSFFPFSSLVSLPSFFGDGMKSATGATSIANAKGFTQDAPDSAS